jgi:prepilin-type N-terminal cleavage/methylation domain-containing protein
MTTHQRQLGFSLVELLIVVGIIGIISAIAVPNLITSKRAANEASAVSTLRLIFTAQQTYRATAGAGSFGDFGDLESADLIDSVVSASDTTAKSGYLFTNVPLPQVGFAAFNATAEPKVASGTLATGTRSWLVTETGVLYFATGGTAPACTADDSRAVSGGAPSNW